jgi:hypothetical protein
MTFGNADRRALHDAFGRAPSDTPCLRPEHPFLVGEAALDDFVRRSGSGTVVESRMDTRSTRGNGGLLRFRTSDGSPV